MSILGIDPGTGRFGISLVKFHNGALSLLECKTVPPEEAISIVNDIGQRFRGVDLVVLEEMKSYGMRVPTDCFQSCVLGGIVLRDACLRNYCDIALGIPRSTVKACVCMKARATDAEVRRALIERYGEVGTKIRPGVFYGVKADGWAAVAVCVAARDTLAEKRGLSLISAHTKILLGSRLPKF